MAMPLSAYEASPGVQVELCSHCRGLFLDRHEIRDLVGHGSLAKATEIVPVSLGEELTVRCPKCVDPVMQPLRVQGAPPNAESWQCRTCGGLWLADGAFFALARALRASSPAEPSPAQPTRTLSAEVRSGLAHSRSRYDAGLENVLAVPLVLLISWLLCSTNLGRVMASLVGMPFHELGHAAASWLSSRIAIPLPFFTFWFDEQSVFMGLVVAGTLGWLMVHTYREQNWFMLGAASTVLVAWAVTTFAVPPTRTLMWQILAGGWGEILFGAFLLIAFYFPLPDRFRWDFWRWIALVPAALTLTQATLLWRTVATDVSQMPWGSAVGSDSDGDMNRLVQQFSWNANDLADFYLHTAYICLAALFVAFVYATFRFFKNGGFTGLSKR
ncbi:MAG: zf-TFIIB domain-containing protein [Polyangiales bacterium]